MPNLTLTRERIDALPQAGLTIVATGPLTAAALAQSIGRDGRRQPCLFRCHRPHRLPREHRHGDRLARARWDKGAEASIALGSDGKDYINCPMNKAQYLAFREELLAARRPSSRVGGQHPYFDGCMPVK
jgi:methylenetetrahydrofolate--tRNA-(uracil-5-)-methyltransferase